MKQACPDDPRSVSAHGPEQADDLRPTRELAETIVDTVREGLLVLDPDLRVRTANASFYRMFDVDRQETEGRLVYELGNGQWNIPELRTLLEHILPERKVLTDFEVEHAFETIGQRVMLLNARRLDDHDMILLAIEDVTEHRASERELRARVKALSESEECYRLLVESAQEYAILMLDAQGRITMWNTGAERIFGYTEREAIGLGGAVLFTPEDRSGGVPEAELETAERTGRAAAERWYVRQDGSRFWAGGVTESLRHPDGRLRGFATVLRDNTRRRQAEEALRDSEAKLSTILERLPVGVGMTDAQGRTLSLNPAGLRLHGFASLDEMIVPFGQYREAFELRYPDGRLMPPDAWPLARALRGDYVNNYEVRLRRHPDGEERIIAYSTVPVADGRGGPRHVVFVMQDVTDRRRSEEILRESEQQLTLVIDTAPAFIAHCDRACRFRLVNRAYAERFGRAPDDLVGRHVAEVLGQPAFDTVKPYIDEVLTGRAVEFETSVDLPTGHHFMHARYAPQVDPDGTVSGFVAVVSDITERKRAEVALRRLNETLESRVGERTRQVRALAHRLTMAEQEERRRLARILHDDLQQLLFGLGISLSLASPPAAEQAAQMLSKARAILDQATQLTRTLSIELSPPVLQTNALDETLHWLAIRKRELHNLEVEVDIPGPLYVPSQNIRVLLYHVLREVLFNVAKHAGVDRARLKAWQEADTLFVRVEDDGAGFDPSDWEKDGYEGSGLGLAGIRERMELVDGRVEINSAPGKGTRITIAIPVDTDG